MRRCAAALPVTDGVAQALGLQTPFIDAADFSLMTSVPMFIGHVVHRVAVQVTEEGTTTAAATGVHMQRKGKIRSIKFVVDRPFFFCVEESASGLPLFTGASRAVSAASVFRPRWAWQALSRCSSHDRYGSVAADTNDRRNDFVQRVDPSPVDSRGGE